MFNPIQAIGATFAAMIGAGMLVRSISYDNSPVPKHLAWMLHAGKFDLCVIEFPARNSRHPHNVSQNNSYSHF